ncbi:hypothetical protein [Pedobacter jejuensis]|uniref:hypothetical protein n=1 Tax=Pedobacter jejuensis TaxID=1268550 RepID=UPI00142D8AE5|nr:hypothetical protein [Pedobacter jejuensis]
MENQFKAGDKVCLKNNGSIVYIFLSSDGEKATCLNPQNGEEQIWLIALMPYKASDFLF